YVLTIFQSGFRELKVSPNWCDHRDGINLCRGHQLRTVSSELDAGIRLLASSTRGLTFVCYSNNLSTLQTGQVPDHIWTPITKSHNTKFNHLSLRLPWAYLKLQHSPTGRMFVNCGAEKPHRVENVEEGY